MIRNPIVAGKFYSAGVDKIETMLSAFAGNKNTLTTAKAIILPHAGYVYSGKVAAITAAKISAKPRVILLGPNHTGRGADFSLWDKGVWAIPGANISIDVDLAERILAKPGPIKIDYQAHLFEHSLEVELPILKYFWRDFAITPICCQTASIEVYAQAADQIYEAVKSIKNEIIFVASSDMTHYEPDALARKKDRLAMEAIMNLDEEELIKIVERENISMCGVAPVAIMLNCVKRIGAKKANVALYQTSGDITGEFDAVVGYAGIIVS